MMIDSTCGTLQYITGVCDQLSLYRVILFVNIVTAAASLHREILLKAENSRTAKGISRRIIRQFEVSEQKKDSELEKVRGW